MAQSRPGKARARDTQESTRQRNAQPVNGAADLAQLLFGEPDPREDENPKKKAKVGRRKENPEDFDIFLAVDPELQEDVDLTILDYLVYEAFEALVDARVTLLRGDDDVGFSSADRAVAMVHSWLGFLQLTQVGKSLPGLISFRLQLLQLLILFVNRLRREPEIVSEASLAVVRQQNARRANTWRICRSESVSTGFDKRKEFPLDNVTLVENRILIYEALNVTDLEPESWAQDFFGTPASASLADILLQFMEVTTKATEVESDWEITTEWMRIAAEWMLQATVEAYLVRGASGDRLLNEIFAFGHIRGRYGDDIDDATDRIFSLFTDKAEPGKELKEWTRIRQHYMNALLPKMVETGKEALMRASQHYPLRDFETKVLELLLGIHHQLPKPDLRQVEDGRIDGVSEQESIAMLERMGLS